jgi:transforming growth factor-beta-induced protein
MKKHFLRLIAVLLALSLIAAACGDDDDAAEDTSTDAPAEEAQEPTEDQPQDEAADEPGTIVDVAVANGSFTTLVAAVQAAGLVETLSGEGPFTVLAPTDEAFTAALEALGLTAEELLANTELLTAVLTYHVLAGEIPASQVVTLDGESVATLNGAEITITVEGDTVMINGATVAAVDVAASNGLIHVIDSVLLPPS